MDNILEVDSVIKIYNNKTILSDIYMSCCAGDIVGLFGRNGSGKSTLLKIIFGSINTQNKFIKINNKVIVNNSLLKKSISYLPQDSYIPKNLKLNKAIKLFLENDFYNSFCNDEIINSVLNIKISQLSIGQLRYVETKLILWSNAMFALLDEPFQGLSPFFIEKIKSLIIECSKTKGIIITDHDYKNVLDIVTKMYCLTNANLALLTNKEQLVNYGYLTVSNV